MDENGSSRRQGAQAGNANALSHGLTSESRIRPAARNQKRRLYRQLGITRGDLDPLGRGYLDLLARLLAKIEVADAYLEEHGMLRSDGTPQPVMAVYVSLTNSSRLTLARLEEHLRKRGKEPGAALADYLEATYADAVQD